MVRRESASAPGRSFDPSGRAHSDAAVTADVDHERLELIGDERPDGPGLKAPMHARGGYCGSWGAICR